MNRILLHVLLLCNLITSVPDVVKLKCNFASSARNKIIIIYNNLITAIVVLGLEFTR